MKPTSSRAARRLAKKNAKAAPLTLQDLTNRVGKARPRGVDAALLTRAKRILMSYLETALGYGMPVQQVIDEMASGQTAWRLGHAVRDEMLKVPPDAVRNAACKLGCAFGCILWGDNGGVITVFEVAMLHAALLPLQGQRDGRDWHANACPALDPETQACRTYEARPMICRSFLSTDAAACEANADGGEEQGAGLLGSHLDYLAIHAVCRQVLKGIQQTHTYDLAETARSAVTGATQQDALAAARQAPSTLEHACRDTAG